MWQKKLSLTGAVCLIVRAVEEILTNEWFSPSLQSKVFDPLIPARFECSVIIVGRCLLYKFESYAKRSIFDFVMPSGAVSDLLKLQDCQRKHSQIIGRVAGKRKENRELSSKCNKAIDRTECTQHFGLDRSTIVYPLCLFAFYWHQLQKINFPPEVSSSFTPSEMCLRKALFTE